MEGHASTNTEEERMKRLIRADFGVTYDSSETERSDSESPLRTSRNRNTAILEDLDAIEPYEPDEEPTVETQPVISIPQRRIPSLNVTLIHRGVIISQAVFSLAVIALKVVALAVPRWACNSEMMKNGTKNACCGPWKICDTLMTLDNEQAFDSFEEIGSFGVANISLLSVFSAIALMETAAFPKFVKVPWTCLVKVKMIISCTITIIYAVIISIFHNMITDLKRIGFRAGVSIDIIYVGFVSGILMFVLILLEYCALTLSKDPPPTFMPGRL